MKIDDARDRTTMRLALLPCALLVLAACGQPPQGEVKSKPTLDATTITFPADSTQLASLTMEPAASAQPTESRLTGRVVWNEERTARLVAPVAGRVTSIIAKPGEAVRAGQTLAFIASAEIGQAQADARRAAADYALGQKNLARVRDLVDGGVAPRKELVAAEAEFARAEAELARARARLKLYGGGEAVDQSYPLRSPIAGTIVERNINPGQELRPDGTPAGGALFVVTDPTSVWIMLDVAERDIGLVRAGQAIQLSAVPYPGEIFEAKIDLVSDFVDPASRVVKVRARMDNRERKLKGEMFVTGIVRGGEQAGVELPARAVFLNDEQYYTWVSAGPAKFTRVPVKLEGGVHGPTNHVSIRVVAGVDAGQKVVVDGSLLLQRLYTQLAKR